MDEQYNVYKYCLSSNWQCENLIIYPSNKRKPDQCKRFAVFVDRDRSRKPLRCEKCLEKGL